MREPPFHVRLLGHPVVAAPVVACSALTLYLWSQSSDFALPGIAAVAALAVVGKASQHRAHYRRWQQAWDSFEDRPPARSGPWLGLAVVGVVVTAALVAQANGLLSAWAGPAMLVGVVAVTAMMIRRMRRVSTGASADGGSRSAVVSICARPLTWVPSLREAYQSLPAHCYRVLNPEAE